MSGVDERPPTPMSPLPHQGPPRRFSYRPSGQYRHAGDTSRSADTSFTVSLIEHNRLHFRWPVGWDKRERPKKRSGRKTEFRCAGIKSAETPGVVVRLTPTSSGRWARFHKGPELSVRTLTAVCIVLRNSRSFSLPLTRCRHRDGQPPVIVEIRLLGGARTNMARQVRQGADTLSRYRPAGCIEENPSQSSARLMNTFIPRYVPPQ